MRLTLIRFHSTKEETLGLLFVDGQFECYTLEDEIRTKKVFKETAIPPGSYYIQLRREGGMHQRYNVRFPHLHQGMLELQDVPNFTYVYLHIGNEDSDTAGCILVGSGVYMTPDKQHKLLYSTNAYKSLYTKVIDALQRKEQVLISIFVPRILSGGAIKVPKDAIKPGELDDWFTAMEGIIKIS